ncbi:MAG: enoyl-CoA hydratase-related protein [Sphingomonadales bacterium]
MAAGGEFETLSYRVAANGVAFITIDVKDRKLNVLTPELHREIGQAAELLAADENAVGAVVHSGKSSFMAGGDLNRIVQYYDMNRSPEEAYSRSRPYSRSLRKLETCGKPVAVAINGTALGGGLELALACHYRVVTGNPRTLLGFPEVTLGLLPGGGGTQRLPRLVGLKAAAELILSGRRIPPAEALEMGIVDKLAAADDLVAEAEKWVLEDGVPQQPWDLKGFQLPGGAGLNNMNIGRLFQKLTAEVAAETRHNYPAPIAILRCLFNGSTVRSMDAALKIESREFSALTRDPVARNMIRTLFINKSKAGRPDEDQQKRNDDLLQSCQQAYIREGLNMVSEGIKPALIENAAFAAGLKQGPLALADGKGLAKAEGASADAAEAGPLDVEDVKARLLCVQALAAAEYWEKGLIEPVDADLASLLGWGFPSYTGGVISYIDTMGLNAFIALCDRLWKAGGGAAKGPSAWLRNRGEDGERVYPSTA